MVLFVLSLNGDPEGRKGMKIIFTQADFEAQALLEQAGILGRSTEFQNPTDAGNKIIALAEKIKAERSVVAMQKGE
jgi:hypothetical protein